MGKQHLFRLCSGADIRLDRLVAGKELIRFFIGDSAADDNVVALFPVRRGGDLVLRGELDGVEDANDFIEITEIGRASCRERV